jgi:hypothetical protein
MATLQSQRQQAHYAQTASRPVVRRSLLPDWVGGAWTAKHWMGALLLGLAVPLTLFVLLPAVGIETALGLFSFSKMIILLAVTLFGIAYWFYMRWVIRNPQPVAIFYVVVWPILEYFRNLLQSVSGVNAEFRPLVLVCLIPAVLVPGLAYFRPLWRTLPQFKYFMGFWLWLLTYFVFNNANAVDPAKARSGNTSFGGSLALNMFNTLTYSLVGVLLGALVILNARNPQQWFDRFNKIFCVFIAITSAVCVVGFPLGFFAAVVDGFNRLMGLSVHPNMYAHQMGISLIYLIGLSSYYLVSEKGGKRMPGWLLNTALLTGGVAFLMALSKTGIATLTISSVVMLSLGLTTPALRRRAGWILGGGIIAIPIAILAYNLISGQDLFSILEARIEDTSSMSWRERVWDSLLADLHGIDYLFGKGLTASNAWVYQLSYNDTYAAEPLIHVHNGYVQLLYDCGLPGLLYFGTIWVMGSHCLLRWWTTRQPSSRALYVTTIGLAIYFSVVCGFDELISMFNAPLLFWFFSSMTFSLAWRESQQQAPEVAGFRRMAV